MIEKKTYNLSDICRFVTNRTCNIENYISTENMLPNKGGITSPSNIPSGSAIAYQLGDVLISNIRPYFQKIWQANCDGACSADVLCIRANEKANSKYLYYLLSQQKFFDYVMSGAKGCKMPRGDKSQIMQWQITLPPLAEQKRIADILSAIDDKIELNRRINANLEQQAQALYKSWFVDFEPFGGKMPEDWKEGTLGEICTCYLGGTPSRTKSEYWSGNIPWINSGEVNKFRIIEGSEFITELGLKKSATKLLPKKTTVLAITGATLGQVSLLEIDSCANQSVIGILENKCIPYEFIYPLIKNDIDKIIRHQTGGAQQHINKNNTTLNLLP